MIVLLLLTLWGETPHAWIVERAIASLPEAERRLFVPLQDRIIAKCHEADTIKREVRAEQYNHYFHLDVEPNPGSDEKEVSARHRGYPDGVGRLPYALEEQYGRLVQSLASNDTDQIVHHAGYLLHYIGDAAQPLHATKKYDCKAGGCSEDHKFHHTVDSDCFKPIKKSLASYVCTQPLGDIGVAREQALTLLRRSAEQAETLWSIHRANPEHRALVDSPKVQEIVRARLIEAVDLSALFLHSAWAASQSGNVPPTALPRPKDVAHPTNPSPSNSRFSIAVIGLAAVGVVLLIVIAALLLRR